MSAPYYLSAGERRAVRAALPYVRCPSCNHAQLSIQDIRALSVLCSCGYYGVLTVRLSVVPYNGGLRSRAGVAVTSEAGVSRA